MPHRSLSLLLGSGAAAVAVAVTTGAWAYDASAGVPAYEASRTTSHWFAQFEPTKGQGVILRNGTTPASTVKYQVAVQVTSRHHRLSCLAEERNGVDLGQERTIAAGDTNPIILATAVPARMDYNLICYGTTPSRQMLKGTIIETSRQQSPTTKDTGHRRRVAEVDLSPPHP